MTEAQIRRELTCIFREQFDDPTLDLRAETTARDVDGWDSARMVSIILAVEEAFEIEMSSREIDAFACVGDFVALIHSRQRGA